MTAAAVLVPPEVEVVEEHPSGDGSAAEFSDWGPQRLREVARDGGRAVLRIAVAPPTAAFTAKDRLQPGFPAASTAAAELGFAPVIRAPGGRMAAYHQGTVCLDLIVPDRPGDADPWQRMAVLADRVAAALRGLGVDARVGAVPLEYCPGDYSVNAAGRVKLAGIAARRIRGATLFGAVVVVRGADSLRKVITAVYEKLDHPLDPATVSAVEDHASGTTTGAVADALRDAVVGDTAEPAARPSPPQRWRAREEQRRAS